MSKIVKISGFLYFIFHGLLFAALFILSAYTSVVSQQHPLIWTLLLFPALGMSSGYWIRTGKFGWFRNLLIAISLVFSIAIVWIAFVAGPQLDQLKAEKDAQQYKQQLPEVTQRLFLALYAADIDTISAQLAKGIDVNSRNETQQTPLHVTQNATIAQLLIQNGADIHAEDDLGDTPIFNKEIEVAEVLLNSGVDIDDRNAAENTLFIRYTYAGYLDGLKFLVNRGTDVNACNKDNQNALDIAEHFHPNTDVLTYLKSLSISDCP